MAQLSLITTCMGRLAHLQQSLPAAVGQPDCTCIVVDYSCPEKCGDWVESHFPTVKVVRVPGQTEFNASRARNAGAKEATTPWLGFFDADIILHPQYAAHVLPLLHPGNFYLPQLKQRGLTGSVICARADFESIGGYDENYVGWGGEDTDLYIRLAWLGAARQLVQADLLSQIQHSDALRTAHLPVKSKERSQTINMLYRIAKLDLMRLFARLLTQEELVSLYADASEAVAKWRQTRKPSEWHIALRQNQPLMGGTIQSALIYTLNELPPRIT